MKYERAGKPKLPQWWTDLAFPALQDADYGEVAEKASKYAGRKSPWKRDAISKFVSGVARTRELANGISHALGIAQPFFTARSEQESKAIKNLMEAFGPTLTPDQQSRLQVLDELGDEDEMSAIDQTHDVESIDDDKRGPGGGRPRRITRQRS